MNAYTPKHIGITMDGNGRWGKARGLTRSEGHYAGAQTMEKIIDASIMLQVEILTLYAFSSENWSRPTEEVSYLMYLPIQFFKQKLPGFMKRNIKIMFSGDMDKIPAATLKAIKKAVKKTANNRGLIVNFAFNYSGREEILNVIKQLAIEVENNRLKPEQLTEDTIQRCLYTSKLPDPELLIRTGGEKRLSNFLLWQASEAELYFTDVYFPDFNKELLEEAIVQWQMKNIDTHPTVLQNYI